MLGHTCEYFTTVYKMNQESAWSLRQLHTTKTQKELQFEFAMVIAIFPEYKLNGD